MQSLFLEGEARVIGKAGDAVIFTATLQHCAMPNHSKASRSVLLIQYLAKYVRPMEDQKRMLTKAVKKIWFVLSDIDRVIAHQGRVQGQRRSEEAAPPGLPLPCRPG